MKNKYKIDRLNEIDNSISDTFFIVAGIQYFENEFHNESKIREGNYYIPQPVIRLKFKNDVSNKGLSTSFVNLTTAKLNTTLDEHLANIEMWLSALSSIGFYIPDLTIKEVSYSDNTKKGFWRKTTGTSLLFYYYGLGIGDAGFIMVPQKSRSHILISDIGFGLERLIQALNRNDYFDNLIPNDDTKKIPLKSIDYLRTLTLLYSCSLSHNKRGTLQAFNYLCNQLSKENLFTTNFFEIINNFYDQWNLFISPSKTKNETFNKIYTKIREKYLKRII